MVEAVFPKVNVVFRKFLETFTYLLLKVSI